MSERRACRLLELARSTKRYRSRRSERDQELKQQLRAWAEKRPRFGYRRLWAELVRAGWRINHKRVYRLYRPPATEVCATRGRGHAEPDAPEPTLVDGFRQRQHGDRVKRCAC